MFGGERELERTSHRHARVQSQFSRTAEARTRHEFEGIHPQSGRDLRCFSWRSGWRPCDRDSAPGDARVGARDDFRRRQLRPDWHALRRAREVARRKLRPPRRHVPERTDLDVARAAPRTGIDSARLSRWLKAAQKFKRMERLGQATWPVKPRG